MRDKHDSGKWSEDEAQAISIGKHEDARQIKNEAY